jgi:flavin reductase (DIM6/NTAB) family NADH-FMN oxidoreductase RutF
MKQIDPKQIGNQHLHKLMLGGIAPRPIAFASTIDEQGNPNLSPFSFYNAFGVNPTTLIFSPSRRGRDNTTKHTYENLKKVPEVVLNAVTFNMVQQMSLSSTEYDKGVNEFVKSGFTAVESVRVKPFRVKESPLQFECIVREIIETGGKAGSANLVVSEIVYVHVDEAILDENGLIDQHKIDLVGRLGGDYYVRASGEALFTVPKPITTKGIGVDQLPDYIRLSKYLTGNDLGKLGNLERLPDDSEIKRFKSDFGDSDLYQNEQKLHLKAKLLIDSNKSFESIMLLMAAHTD